MKPIYKALNWSNFHGVNRLSVLSFENDAHWRSQKWYFLPTIEIKDYNVIIDGKNFFDQPVKNDLITYENIQKNAAGKGNDYTTGCLLDNNYFKNYYQMIAIDLGKQQALDIDPRAMQQINFTGNSNRGGQTTMFFIFEEAKETILDFS